MSSTQKPNTGIAQTRREHRNRNAQSLMNQSEIVQQESLQPQTAHSKRSILMLSNFFLGMMRTVLNRERIREREAIKIVKDLRSTLYNELLCLLEEEQRREEEREQRFRLAKKEEQGKLEVELGIERAKASERIVKLSE